MADGALVAEMTGHGDKVQSLAVSPQDGSIASGDMSGEIRLWDGSTGAFCKVLAKQGDEVGSLSFSPDGTLAAVQRRRYAEACGHTEHIYRHRKRRSWPPIPGTTIA